MPWSEDVKSFATALNAINSVKDLRARIADITTELGFDYYAIVHHMQPPPDRRMLRHMERGEMIWMDNLPDGWMERYRLDQLIRVDPVIEAASRQNLIFQWSSVTGLSSDQRQFMERKESMGVGDGYMIPARGRRPLRGSGNFSMRSGKALPVRSPMMLHLIGQFAFEAAERILVEQSRKEVKRLTQRQRDCLILSGRGYTEAESAVALAISQETVRHHLKEARQLFGVRKTFQVVLQAIWSNQIDIEEIISPTTLKWE